MHNIVRDINIVNIDLYMFIQKYVWSAKLDAGCIKIVNWYGPTV